MVKIEDKSKCVGCGACFQICSHKALSMQSDEEGFLYPVVENPLECVNCGLCERVCPISNSVVPSGEVLKVYAGYAKDDFLRECSSSGGLFGVLAKEIIIRGGVVFGATIGKSQDVFHTSVERMDDLPRLQGSKYVQSNTCHVYDEVRTLLKNGRKVLFSGTACQIAGLNSFLGKKYNNLYTVDVLCHGVPSPKVWRKYIDWQEKTHGATVKQTYLRRKNLGWKRYSVELQFSDSTEYKSVYNHDTFMRLFLSNICLRPSCYECKFKSMIRPSDITLGDAWGIERIIPEFDDDRGTSVVVIHSNKGRRLIEEIQEKITIKELELDKAIPRNADSRKSVQMHPNRKKFFRSLDKNKGWEELIRAEKITLFDRIRIKLLYIIKQIRAFL